MLQRFGCSAACLAAFACPWCRQHLKASGWFVAQEAVEAVVGILGMAPCDGTDAVPPNARSHTVLLAGTLIGDAQVCPACTTFCLNAERMQSHTLGQSSCACGSPFLVWVQVSLKGQRFSTQV